MEWFPGRTGFAMRVWELKIILNKMVRDQWDRSIAQPLGSALAAKLRIDQTGACRRVRQVLSINPGTGR